MVRYLNVFFTTVHLSQPTTPEQRMGSPSAARREAGQSRLAALHTPCVSVWRLELCSVLSSRNCQLLCAAVSSDAQLCKLWVCSACGVLNVAAAYSSYASQRARLEAPSACTCSCRL